MPIGCYLASHIYPDLARILPSKNYASFPACKNYANFYAGWGSSKNHASFAEPPKPSKNRANNALARIMPVSA